ncbi:ORF153 [Xestia c-nigrum granulovirus]|uniref:ORF153 n=1 Tax=Xestia c-nigrum granulosis virus TaxID=51677 RepID=Q9PYP3_GVXN|nr:ORF153 [Xestia c-nigrum granulovirus]AAF05267.1 ORF153 [Xestia c-nigrum granulovirus]
MNPTRLKLVLLVTRGQDNLARLAWITRGDGEFFHTAPARSIVTRMQLKIY